MTTHTTPRWAAARSVAELDEGFTLIELLVVVIIIGILAAIAIPVYLGVQNNAKDSTIKQDLGNAKTATVAYLSQTGGYPSSVTAAATASTPSMASLGYAGPSSPNVYSSAPAFIGTPTVSTGFCIGALGVTGNAFTVNQSGGVKSAGTSLPTSC